MAIAEDAAGKLWFGTFGGGLAGFEDGGFQVYTTEHGLSSNEIVGLQPQGDGSLRVLTSAGFGSFVDGRCSGVTRDIGGRPIGRVYYMATDGRRDDMVGNAGPGRYQSGWSGVGGN